MYKADTTIRVRYGETDQMGYVYYGNYAMYYEVARVEALRQLGLTYRELEEQGIMMPVVESHFKFLKPATYDENLTISVTIPKLPGIKILFTYEVRNENQELINTGETTLTFIKMDSGKPCLIPEVMADLLNPYFPVVKT